MRHSEEMAYELYLSDCKLSQIGTPGSSVQPRTWDELDYDEEQLRYLGYVNAAFEYLFEHGRISSYVSIDDLRKFREEYKAYLAEKGR
jgi:hypothetical protein